MKKIIFFFALYLISISANLYSKNNAETYMQIAINQIKEAKLRKAYEAFVTPNFDNFNRTTHNVGSLKHFNTNKFRKYNNVKEGYNSLIHDLTLKATGKSIYTDDTTTLYELIHIYAPSFENDCNKYLQVVCSETGLQPDMLLKDIDVRLLARGIIRMENINNYKQLFT